jgi:hypothetical protein
MTSHEFTVVETVLCDNCGAKTHPTADVHGWDQEYCIGCVHEGVPE